MKRTFTILVMLLSLALASCGSTGPTTTIDVVMTDFQFQPSQFTVPAGQEITFRATNNGAVVHNFIVMKLGTSAGPFFEDDDEENVYWEEVDIQPGGDINVTFTAPTEPGEYEIICKTEGHIASGMVGKLIVVAEE